ncbi:transcriptional regulator [Cupriavidus sp. 2TAF22]|uniref:transcriptional regulator n=1 Tax=unclassified Cupriavidus TaxID=2640874 RepID=UPI003F8EFC23
MSDSTIDEGGAAAAPEDLDPALVSVLQILYAAARDPAGRPWSLAKISKQAALQMSVLRRVLTQLRSVELADTEIGEDGRGTARLTPAGVQVCAQLFAR